MNLLLQSVNNQFKGFIKIKISTQKIGNHQEPHVVIDIENSKFEIKPKDAQRLSRLERETAFAKILETKVDLNFKLAKVLSNAQNWKIDFNGFK